MTSSLQLERALRGVPGFLGVFSRDKLPPFNELTPNSSLIVNNQRSGQAGMHWEAMLNLRDPSKPPALFDSFGWGDQLGNVTNEHTDFNRYLRNISQRSGHHGQIRTNNLALQCVKDGNKVSDVCGEYCVWAIKHGLPLRDNGSVNPGWKGIVRINGGCQVSDKIIKRVSGVRGKAKNPHGFGE